MVEDKAKSNFSVILSNFRRKFEIIQSKWTEKKFYEIKIRTEIHMEDDDYNKYCDLWVEKFSTITDTVWVNKISNTGPKVKFRKQYQCWPYSNKEVDKELLFDARKCKATLDIKVLADSLIKKRANRYAKLGLNVLVKINFNHLHETNTEQNYSFFIHECNPIIKEVPQRSVSSTEKVAQLVAKVVENAPKTSQKVAERVKEIIQKQQIHSQLEENEATIIKEVARPQIITTNNLDDGPINGNVYFIRQMVFDSTTQTLKEMISPTINPELIEVQIPTSSNILNTSNSSDAQII